MGPVRWAGLAAALLVLLLPLATPTGPVPTVEPGGAPDAPAQQQLQEDGAGCNPEGVQEQERCAYCLAEPACAPSSGLLNYLAIYYCIGWVQGGWIGGEVCAL